jgi:hypothetical protein
VVLHPAPHPPGQGRQSAERQPVAQLISPAPIEKPCCRIADPLPRAWLSTQIGTASGTRIFRGALTFFASFFKTARYFLHFLPAQPGQTRQNLPGGLRCMPGFPSDWRGTVVATQVLAPGRRSIHVSQQHHQ